MARQAARLATGRPTLAPKPTSRSTIHRSGCERMSRSCHGSGGGVGPSWQAVTSRHIRVAVGSRSRVSVTLIGTSRQLGPGYRDHCEHPSRLPGVTRYVLEALAFARSVLRLGILGGERFHYWWLIAWTLLHKPKALGLAVTLAIYGYHFRRTCDRLAET